MEKYETVPDSGSVAENIRQGRYDNNMDYPKCPTKPKISTYPTTEEVEMFWKEKEEYENLLKEYELKIKLYTKKSHYFSELFKKEALAEVGFDGHPKADLLFGKAYEMRHGCGKSDIFSHLCELADFIREFTKE